MELKKLAKTPTLKKVTVDTDLIVQAYGEPVEFYMYDRQDIPVFLKIAQLRDDQEGMYNLVKEVILDEKGNRMLGDEEILPVEILVDVITAVVNNLGNLNPQTTPA